MNPHNARCHFWRHGPVRYWCEVWEIETRHRILYCLLISFAFATVPSSGIAQGKQAPSATPAPAAQTSPDYAASFPPVKNPATSDQIREYLRVSGESEKYRTRLINTVDKIRYIGKPYWPESFWTSIKQEMQKADLTPMFIVLFQHGISRELMQEVLDSYHRLGADHFGGSPAWTKLEEAKRTMSADTAQLMQTETQALISKVYQVYKPQIRAARAKYMVEQTDWKDN